MHINVAGDMCVCALLYEQNKVLLEGCEKELEIAKRSQNEVSSMETYIHVQCTVSPLSPGKRYANV